MWLTLLVGERILGIPGMILAPVLLHFAKHEMTLIEVSANTAAPAPPLGTSVYSGS